MTYLHHTPEGRPAPLTRIERAIVVTVGVLWAVAVAAVLLVARENLARAGIEHSREDRAAPPCSGRAPRIPPPGFCSGR